MQGKGLLLAENILKIQDSFDSANHLYLDWKISISDENVEWWEAYTRFLKEKEDERKELVESFNRKIMQALQQDHFETALQYVKEANKYIEKQEELVFTRDKYKKIKEVEKNTYDLLTVKDFKAYLQGLKILHRLNPYSQLVEKEINTMQQYYSMLEALEREKDPFLLNKKIRKTKVVMGRLFPDYLEADFREKLDTYLKIIEAKVSALRLQAGQEEKKGELAHAIELLKKAEEIESNDERKAHLNSEISRIKRIISGKRFLRAVGFTIAAIIVIAVVAVPALIEEYQNKKQLNLYIEEMRLHLEKNQLEPVKVILHRVSERSRKLNKKSRTYQDINGILERIYGKLNPYPENPGNFIETAAKQAAAAGQFFRDLPGELSQQWIDKSESIIKLTKQFRTAKESRESGKALTTLIKLKQFYHESGEPYPLLHQVAYTNSSGYLEVNLGRVGFVFVDGGKFEIGCFDRIDYYTRNAPVSTKVLSSFWISKTEITNGIYEGNRSKIPVNYISWPEASRFAGNFGRKYGLHSDLPTEAQWEYAARNGGEKIPYPWGKGIDCSRANYWYCGLTLKPVGSYPPNKLGLYDLAGNVWEWCRDIYHEKAYLITDLKNPFYAVENMAGGGRTSRVIRGGSYADVPLFLRTYMRYFRNEAERDADTGFRVVIEDAN